MNSLKSVNSSALVDKFAIIGQKETSLIVEYNYEYQSNDNSLTEIKTPNLIGYAYPQFFVSTKKGKKIVNPELLSPHFRIVYENPRGRLCYFYCRRINRGTKIFTIAILTKWDFPSLFKDLLDKLAQTIQEKSTRLLSKFMDKVNSQEIPNEGQNLEIELDVSVPQSKEERVVNLRFERLEGCDGIFGDVNLILLFKLLKSNNIMQIFASLLFEQKVILVSGSTSRLCVSNAFLSILYPFTWSHTFIPFLPRKNLKVCERKRPFFIGIHASNLTKLESYNIKGGYLLVNLDTDHLEYKHRLEKKVDLLPTPAISNLAEILIKLPTLKKIKQIKKSSLESSIFLDQMSHTFVEFFRTVFGNYWKFLKEDSDNQTNQNIHLNEWINSFKGTSQAEFIEHFKETKMYRAFFRKRISNLIEKKFPSGMFERVCQKEKCVFQLTEYDEKSKKNKKKNTKKNKITKKLLGSHSPFSGKNFNVIGNIKNKNKNKNKNSTLEKNINISNNNNNNFDQNNKINKKQQKKNEQQNMNDFNNILNFNSLKNNHNLNNSNGNDLHFNQYHQKNKKNEKGKLKYLKKKSEKLKRFTIYGGNKNTFIGNISSPLENPFLSDKTNKHHSNPNIGETQNYSLNNNSWTVISKKELGKIGNDDRNFNFRPIIDLSKSENFDFDIDFSILHSLVSPNNNNNNNTNNNNNKKSITTKNNNKLFINYNSQGSLFCSSEKELRMNNDNDVNVDENTLKKKSSVKEKEDSTPKGNVEPQENKYTFININENNNGNINENFGNNNKKKRQREKQIKNVNNKNENKEITQMINNNNNNNNNNTSKQNNTGYNNNLNDFEIFFQNNQTKNEVLNPNKNNNLNQFNFNFNNNDLNNNNNNNNTAFQNNNQLEKENNMGIDLNIFNLNPEPNIKHNNNGQTKSKKTSKTESQINVKLLMNTISNSKKNNSKQNQESLISFGSPQSQTENKKSSALDEFDLIDFTSLRNTNSSSKKIPKISTVNEFDPFNNMNQTQTQNQRQTQNQNQNNKVQNNQKNEKKEIDLFSLEF
ncbi:suppression of tumorigenicity 5 st5 [Anaeramoeba flamelloides]|uniref:Suppression of tumorigenicity 5 st5 n=1 Tax=Anaeramoeba flamelloides TaxID=1746091 RepID=A0AAV8A3F9_9EUKA|nr:suppression of tumorigenicity 5 st5 [Anaeramoeba flamelloides]